MASQRDKNKSLKRSIAVGALLALIVLNALGAALFTVASSKASYEGTPIIVEKYFFDQLAPSVFRITNEIGTSGGTAFQVRTGSGRKYLVTNQHVCEVADNDHHAWISRDDNSPPIMVTVIKKATTTDLCLLTPAPNAPGLRLAPTSHAGQYALVIGHPFLQPLAVAAGILTRFEPITTSEELKPGNKCDRFGEHIETQTNLFGYSTKMCLRTLLSYNTTIPIYPGNSGSPVVNLDGNVIGVVYAGDRETHDGAMITLMDLQEFLVGY